MQTAMENARAIMESETIKAMQQEIRSLRQTIEALKSNAKVFDAASKEREKRLRDALEPFTNWFCDPDCKCKGCPVEGDCKGEIARQALEGVSER
jgi:ubiquitin